jgi:hypothetical protein
MAYNTGDLRVEPDRLRKLLFLRRLVNETSAKDASAITATVSIRYLISRIFFLTDLLIPERLAVSGTSTSQVMGKFAAAAPGEGT